MLGVRSVTVPEKENERQSESFVLENHPEKDAFILQNRCCDPNASLRSVDSDASFDKA
jgi:hypothetical protein